MQVFPTDQEIIKAFHRGDELVFEKLFKHYYSLLCNYVFRIIKDRDEAEEIVQQTMVKIWEKRHTVEISTSLKSYLYRSVHNAALNAIRHNKVRRMYAEEKVATGESYAPSASQKVMKSELENQVIIALSKLPEQCRMVFKLSRFEEMKYAEIAEHLNISVKTVENHMGKALRLMRENLKEYLVWIVLFIPGLL